MNGLQDCRQRLSPASSDGFADDVSFILTAVAHGVDQRQCGLALGQIIAHVLAKRIGIAAIVQHIIGYLKRGAEVHAVVSERTPRGCIAISQHSTELRRGAEQPGCLGLNDLYIALLADIRFVDVEQLHDLAFGNAIGGGGEDVHDVQTTDLHHHLERPRIEKIPNQHGCLVTPDRIGRAASAAQLGRIDHVVVQQRGGVNELDDGRCNQMRAPLVAAGACCEQDQLWPHALASRTNDVPAEPVNQGHLGAQPRPNQPVHTRHVISHKCLTLIERHCGGSSRSKSRHGALDRQLQTSSRNHISLRGQWPCELTNLPSHRILSGSVGCASARCTPQAV